MPEEDAVETDETRILAEETAGDEGGARTLSDATTAVKVIASYVNEEAAPLIGRGEVRGPFGITLDLEPQDSKGQKIRRHVNFLRFCLENLSRIDPREFTEETPPILGRLDLLQEEGVDVSAVIHLVEKLFDFGRQYESIVACSARE